MPARDSAKDVYKQLRQLTCSELWERMARFRQLPSPERLGEVGLVRAVGVVFSERGSFQEKEEARAWLLELLADSEEKVRRYALTALPKLGSGAKEEKVVLDLLQRTGLEREKEHSAKALEKFGGATSFEALKEKSLSLKSEQKLRANIARSQQPGRIRVESSLRHFKEVQIHLHCRRGLEKLVAEEVNESNRTNSKPGKFRTTALRAGLVEVRPVVPFSIADIYALRCFATIGFVVGKVPRGLREEELIETIARAVASVRSQDILSTWTEGPARYRLNAVKRPLSKAVLSQLADRIYSLCPTILNDPREALWSVDLVPSVGGTVVELRPRLEHDPRLYFRRGEIPAASHPPLAACMARLGGLRENEVVWDPFCGSGLELIERSLLGGVRKIFGTDHSAHALKIARTNFEAANIQPPLEAVFEACDFRDFQSVPGLAEGSVSLLITNPPLGKRIPIPNLRGLIEDLFRVADRVLKPGGRLVFANPLRIDSPMKSLRLKSREVVDFGGFDCRLEMYEKPI